jgi:hypothetical protein
MRMDRKQGECMNAKDEKPINALEIIICIICGILSFAWLISKWVVIPFLSDIFTLVFHF